MYNKLQLRYRFDYIPWVSNLSLGRDDAVSCDFLRVSISHDGRSSYHPARIAPTERIGYLLERNTISEDLGFGQTRPRSLR